MKLSVGLNFFCTLSFATISSSYAAPENVKVPSGFASTFVPYATIDKRDREPNVVRFIYINPNTTVAEGEKFLPEGTQIVMVERVAQTTGNGETVFNDDGRMIPTNDVFKITVSEKRSGVDAEYAEDMRMGDWEFGVFRPDGSAWPDVDFEECRACHLKAEQTDYTFSVFRNLSEISGSRSPDQTDLGKRVAAKPVL